MIPTLSYKNLDLCIPLCRHIGDGVTLIADNASGGGLTAKAPVALARPANDELAQTGVKAFQLYDRAYGFDHRALYGTNQGIQILFESEFVGIVEVAVRNCWLGNSSTLDFGDYTTPANSSSALYVRATIGSTSSLALYATGGDAAPVRDNNNFSVFKWTWFKDGNPGAGNIQKFAVVRGVNTLTIRGYNNLGDGFICEAVYIRLRRHDSDRNLPRRTMPALPAAVNRAAVDAVLKRARTEPIRVLMMTDSFGVHGGNWAVTLADAIRSTYGAGGLTQRLGGNSSDLGTDLAEYSTTQWATTSGRAATTTQTGGASYGSALVGSWGYEWATGQTGSITHTFTGTSWQLIYETGVSFGSFAYTVDGGSPVNVATAGTASRYGQVGQTGLTYGPHTIVFAKSGSGVVRLMATTTARDTGIVAMRLTQSGSNFGTYYADSLDASWASLLAAYQPHLIIHGTVNNSFVAPTYDLTSYLLPLNNRLPTLCGTSGAVFCVAELFPFTTGTYATPDTYFARHGFPQQEFNTDLMEFAAMGLLSRPVSFVSFTRAVGYANTEAILVNAFGYSSQSTTGGTTSVTNMHPSANGNGIVGQVLAALLTDTSLSTIESDLATLLTRIPGVVQPQSGDASLAVGALELPAVDEEGRVTTANPSTPAPTQHVSIGGSAVAIR